MSLLKSFKTWVRRLFFHPFGYDLVPLKARRKRRERAASRPVLEFTTEEKNELAQYIELFGEEAVRERCFYNVGAGVAFSHPAWTNVDHPSDWYGDDNVHLAWDLLALSPMPVEDAAARIIFCRYTLEHVSDESSQNFFNEARRALGPGGTLRVIVPDVDIYYAAYLAEDHSLFHNEKAHQRTYPSEIMLFNPNEASLIQKFLWTFASSACEIYPQAHEPISDEEFRRIFAERGYEDALDACVARCSLDAQRRHPALHMNWFNRAKLERMMRAAGFSDVYRSGYMQSRNPVLRDPQLFDGRQPEIALYMEARK